MFAALFDNSLNSGTKTEATNIQGILNISMLDVNIMENLLRDQWVTGGIN